MARGLVTRRIPLLVGGGIDTKSNPKLVQPPALLELENMYQLHTGEFTPRNGYSLQSAQNINGTSNLFVTQNGGLGSIAAGWNSIAYVQALRYGLASGGFLAGWTTNASAAMPPHPMITARVTGVQAPVTPAGVATVNAIDPDLTLAAGIRHVMWTDGSTTNSYADLRDLTTGRTGNGIVSVPLSPATAAGRPGRVASTGGSYAAAFWAAGANTLTVQAYNPTIIFNPAPFNIAVDLDALPWFDVKAIPGTNNFAVAYKTTVAGVIKCGIYDPAASTFTSVVATGGADATFCLGWLDDPFSTGSMYLATAGSTLGVVVRVMSATTMVISSTRTIDATATANVRNITGHLLAATPTYVVLWDQSGASTVFDAINRGYWNGAAVALLTVAGGSPLIPNHSLYSRTVRFPDGSYYVLACFGSTVQPTFGLFCPDNVSASFSTVAAPQCYVLSGEAGGRRLQNSLASGITSGSTVIIPASRARGITTPSGTTSPQRKTVALLSFTTMSKVTHARELGSTVFLPGGLIYRDDGATFETPTFPIYPETPTGTSAAAGAMTASGAYSYRVVFRAGDAAGRVYRSAGSVPFAITLGAGDGTVNLAVFNLRVRRGDANINRTDGYGQVTAEIYRRGPAASGATLYNKVGEVLMDTLTDTVAFADTMSDANAALGEAAYFNGQVLENFHPPATRLLEVNGNRVGLVNAEEPTEFWFSKEYKAGTGLAFNPLNKVTITGDGFGEMTALAAMDGNWILFKSGAIYALSGDGPNDLGQGSFNAPRAVSRTVGTMNPSSLLETPDGIMFQATTGGMWLLDRGLNVTYVGAPVERYALAESVVGAAQAASLPMARFVCASGVMLEWDYFHKRWSVHRLRITRGAAASAIADCANSPLFGWCYVLANGDLMKEIAGQANDVNSTTVGIAPLVSFPQLQVAGLAGYQRFLTLDLTLDVLGSFTLLCDAEYNFAGAVTGSPKSFALTPATPTAQIEYNPPEGRAKSTSVRPVLTVSPTTNATFRLTGATMTVGVKRGSNVPPASRMT